MTTRLVTAPAVEPITLAEAKQHLRIDSGDFDDNITVSQSIVPAEQAIVASYGLEGSGVDVLNNAGTLVNLDSGDCTGATVDVKIQESDDDSTYTDWPTGAFTTVTAANDNAVQEIQYTGIKQYIRAVATVAGATAAFGVSVVEGAPDATDDTYITNLIKAARILVEDFTNYRIITQTWEYMLDRFPYEDFIELPYPKLQSVTSVKYYDTDETEATFTSADYHVDIYGIPGKIVLAYGDSWPSTTLRTVNGVVIQYVCGFGLAADVAENYKTAIKMTVAELYENREDSITGTIITDVPLDAKQILMFDRVTPI